MSSPGGLFMASQFGAWVCARERNTYAKDIEDGYEPEKDIWSELLS